MYGRLMEYESKSGSCQSVSPPNYDHSSLYKASYYRGLGRNPNKARVT